MRSPLHQLHERLGARFIDFGGWEMPVQYSGVLEEHGAVRDGVGVFDVSHLGRFEVGGPGAVALLSSQLCNNIERIGPGRAQYTMALNNQGGVQDDIIVWWLENDRFWVMPNGTNFQEIVERFRGESGSHVSVEPVREQTVLLAVQGPDAPEAIESVLGSFPTRFRVESVSFNDAKGFAAGTGYTGERGAEIAVPAESGEQLFEAFIESGATPCGLGARDTLRLEMGYPLWGQDLDAATTPLEADLGWVVSWDHDFVGRDALEKQREHGVERRLVGFRTEGRKIPRPGHRLRNAGATGTVTSGNFSPMLGRGIGMGYLHPPASGDAVEVEIRGEWIEASLVAPPFIER